MCTNHNHKSDLISDAMTDVNLAVEDATQNLLMLMVLLILRKALMTDW